MTFTIRTRGAPGLKVVEYLCPEHGRFEELIADPPNEMPCPAVISERATEAHADGFYSPSRIVRLACEMPSEWVISSPHMKNPDLAVTATVRGGDTDRRPGQLDTRPLAEGMSYSEWRKKQEPARQERRHHELIKKGLKTKRVQV